MLKKIKSAAKFLPQIIGILALVIVIPEVKKSVPVNVIVFSVCAYLAAYSHKRIKQEWSWIFAISAVIYNPIFLIKIHNSEWGLFFIITLIQLIISIFVFREKREKNPITKSIKETKYQDVYKSQAEYIKEWYRKREEGKDKPSPPDVIYL